LLRHNTRRQQIRNYQSTTDRPLLTQIAPHRPQSKGLYSVRRRKKSELTNIFQTTKELRHLSNQLDEREPPKQNRFVRLNSEVPHEWSEYEYRSCDHLQGFNPLMSPFTSAQKLNCTNGRYSHGLLPLYGILLFCHGLHLPSCTFTGFNARVMAPVGTSGFY
jgi:hypothetical protein